MPVAATVSLLRSLDVPLPRVRELLAARDDGERMALLHAERSRLAAEVAHREAALRTLDRLVSGPRAVRYDVRVGPRPSQRLLALPALVEAEKIGPGTAAACSRFASVLPRTRLRPGPFVAVFPLDLAETVRLHVGLPGGGAPPPELEEVLLPAGDWASTVHVGPYDELQPAYAALTGLAVALADRTPTL